MSQMVNLLVIGGGPAGLLAARRGAELGARTALVTRGAFGGMAANDGPVPVRTLAHAARLMREARQLDSYGISVGEPRLDYLRLMGRVREVVESVKTHSTMRGDLDRLGIEIHEHAGTTFFLDSHTVQTATGARLQAEKIVLCSGGASRRLPVPGFEWTVTHSDAWGLTTVPESLLVVGAGATGVQVASIFGAFGTRIQLFEAGPRILPGEDIDVSAAVASAFRGSGMIVREGFGTIERFEKTPAGVRMVFTKDGVRHSAEAALAVVAIGWLADTVGLHLAAAGIETDRRGYVRVDEYLRTSAPHVFAAGDITGRLMLVPQALDDGHVAASNAVLGAKIRVRGEGVDPIGSFTDPEYAQVGLTEAQAREAHDVAVTIAYYEDSPRAIIDGRTTGFCKLIVDRSTRRVLGCHVVGERSVEVIQLAAVAIAAGMRVDELAAIPVSFPTYTGIVWRAANSAVDQLDQLGLEQAPQPQPQQH